MIFFNVDVKNKNIIDQKFKVLQKDIIDGVDHSLLQAGAVVKRNVILNLSNQVLKRRTGRLASSVNQRGVIRQGKARIVVINTGGGAKGKEVPYASIHEKGGTITAKNGKNLTIPVGEALTPAGVARFSAREVIQNPSTFGYKSTFFHKNILLGSKDKQTDILFILKKSVKIPKRPYMKPALESSRSAIKSIFNNEIVSLTRKFNR